MPVISYVNASLEIWGCVVSLIILLCLSFSRRRVDSCDRLFIWMLGCNTAALFFDMIALIYRGDDEALDVIVVRISNFLAYCSGYFLLESFTHYVTEYLGRYTKVTSMPLKIARAICMVSLVMIVATQFHPIIYGYDSNDMYYRADGFWMSQVAGIVVLIMIGWMIIYYRKYISGIERIAFWSYIILPIVALSIQINVYGLALLNLVDTITLVILFLFLQAEQGRLTAERENDLAQSRIAIMLSQIQPHFLYNSLAVIQDMCHDKAPEAEEATVEFAEFLRGNIDSLQAGKPIPFAKELKHTGYYLALEKKRFGDKLTVKYDIETEAFSMPALTLQPIVENAVKYGIMQKEKGGTVSISTKETEDAYYVVVEDDGVGLDRSKKMPDGRSHIGITNVKERLAMMCGGSLDMDSKPGEGTRVMITIPKGGQNEDNSSR